MVVVLSDGRQIEGLAAARDSGRRAAERGVRIYAIGLGEDVDEALLREIAVADGYLPADETDLSEVYARIASVIPGCR